MKARVLLFGLAISTGACAPDPDVPHAFDAAAGGVLWGEH